MSYEERLITQIRSICHTRGVKTGSTQQLLLEKLLKEILALRYNQTVNYSSMDAQFGTGRVSQKIATASVDDQITINTVKKYYLQYCKNTTPLTVGDLEDFCCICNKTPNELLGIPLSYDNTSNAPQKKDPLIMMHSLETIHSLLRSRESYPKALNIVIASIPAIGVSLKVIIQKDIKICAAEHIAYYYYCDWFSDFYEENLDGVNTIDEAWRCFVDKLSEMDWKAFNVYQDIEELHDLYASIEQIKNANTLWKRQPTEQQRNTLDAKLLRAQNEICHKKLMKSP